MARQLWGTYSVADHCTAFPFVADMVLYDRLIVPVPPDGDEDEWNRWAGKKWNPGRQRTLLAELGDYVRRVPWTADLRRKWTLMGVPPGKEPLEQDPEVEDTASFVAGDVEMTARGEREVRKGRQDPFGDTRRLIGRQAGSTLLEQADARVLAVYGEPDRFDRRWRVTRVFPFFSRHTAVQRSDDYDMLRADMEAQQDQIRCHQLATLLVGQLVLPIAEDEKETELDDARAREVLLRARDLLSDPDIAAKRSVFRGWVAAYEPLQLPDRRKVKEFDDLLTAYNASVQGKQRASKVETGLLVLGMGSAGASMVLPGAGMVGDAVGAVGTVAMRYSQPGDWQPGDVRAAALVSEARKKLRGN